MVNTIVKSHLRNGNIVKRHLRLIKKKWLSNSELWNKRYRSREPLDTSATITGKDKEGVKVSNTFGRRSEKQDLTYMERRAEDQLRYANKLDNDLRSLQGRYKNNPEDPNVQEAIAELIGKKEAAERNAKQLTKEYEKAKERAEEEW